MCRHLAYLGPPRTLAEVLLEPSHSLCRQSWAPRRQTHGTVNADGFGVGWYPAPEGGPLRYRRAVPVWADPNLPDLAGTLRSGAVLAAVRDATTGTSYDEAAVAPYRTGRWLFSHNGAVADWERLPEDTSASLPAANLLALESRCDAALLWAMIHARIAAGEPAEWALSAVVRETAAVRPGARLNLLLTDGNRIIASAWGDTLSFRTDDDGGVLAASEPCDEEPGWQDVPDGSLLLADRTGVRTVPLAASHVRAAEPAAPAPSSPAVLRLAVTERNSRS